MSNTTQAPTPEAIETKTKTRDESRPKVLTAHEVAALLRVNRKTVYAAFKLGEIPGGRRIGGTIRFHRDAVLNWLAQGQERALRSPKGAR
jgi:excisionase family DNA binding protein